MRTTESGLILAATDLSNFLACLHRTALDFAAAHGQLTPPASAVDAYTRRLRERGEAHERAYLQCLRDQRLSVVEVPQDQPPASRVEATIAALKSGADVVYQAAFAGQGWIGYADILRKVSSEAGRSRLGDFLYEPYDTKLARETRGGTILQLAIYADLLGEVQGVPPERFFVVAPGAPFAIHEYRLVDYAAYVRSVRRNLLETLAVGPDDLLAGSYPEPNEHCDICRWWERCEARWRADDHVICCRCDTVPTRRAQDSGHHDARRRCRTACSCDVQAIAWQSGNVRSARRAGAGPVRAAREWHAGDACPPLSTWRGTLSVARAFKV